MQGQPLDAGLLLSLARRREVEVLSLLPMASGLEPATDHDMVDQQDLRMVGGEHESAGGEMAGKGIAAVERMALRHLPAQQREMLARAGDLAPVARDGAGEAGVEVHGVQRVSAGRGNR